MVDASALPYQENVAATAELTAWCHDRGVYVEAEFGEVGGKDGVHAPGVRTDPDEALAFVARRGWTRSPWPSAPRTRCGSARPCSTRS